MGPAAAIRVQMQPALARPPPRCGLREEEIHMCREMVVSTISALPEMMERVVPAPGRSVSASLTTRGPSISVGIKGGSLIQLGAPDLGAKEVSQSGVRSQNRSRQVSGKSSRLYLDLFETCSDLFETCVDF